MPITPLPASNTKRYFWVWTVGSLEHRTQIRVSDDFENGDALAQFAGDLAILSDIMANNVAVTSIEVAANGSDIRNPVAGWTVVPGLGTNDPVTGQDLARSFSIRGRSTTGRKMKSLLWGLILGEQPDFEYTIVPETPAGDFMASITGHLRSWLAIDGSKPVFKGNWFEDYNDHWQRELRP